MSEQPTTTTASATNGQSNPDDIRKSFIEQVKARKAALEKRRQEEAAAAAAAAAPTPAPTPETPKTETEAPASTSTTTSNVEETTDASAPKKELTFAERLKLKKQAANAASNTTAEGETKPDPAAEEPKSTATDKEETITEESKETENKGTPATEGENLDEQASTEQKETEEQASKEEEEEEEEIDDGSMTVSKLLERLKEVPPIDDIYSFKYPEGIEGPNPIYKKENVKYTYGPTFILQFKDRFKVKADKAWIQSTGSKVVIPVGMNKSNKSSREPSNRFGGRGGAGNDFRSNSMRNESRSSSKRKSRRNVDDRRSNRDRSYTSRRDRERGAEFGGAAKKDETPKEEVAPFVPSANRWVPKSRAKKSEKKMAPDGVTELLDAEDVERKMKSLLNKLTLEKFDTISTDIINIANQSKWETQGETLKIVIEQIFHKACDEPHWSSMYAQLCGKVVKELSPEISDETNEGKTGPKLILHYLVARCHTEFQKGWSDKLPTNEDGSPLEPEMMSDEYYQAAAAKRRGLGLVRLIGFLYCLNLLTGKMMFECFRRLMKDLTDNPSEETLESVVELLTTVGEQFERDSFRAGDATLEGSALLDSLFQLLDNVIETGKISNRIKFKLIDIKELREDKNWNSAKKNDGPKTISQIHEEEERARQLKASSRSNSRRTNNSMGGSNRSSRRDYGPPKVSKDNFTTTRSFSQRNNARAPPQKEEPKPAAPAATNMFSALLGNDDDDEDDE
ncbi:translation initiation factor eIF4G NDAI_0H00430 [Naumovozyma dairenensis CBS 421]|uniref:MIF4G domain-containing protein n=1 Tax=Naumovozyma dairenensis (strain ATCC 10597 / BCRC 20456 / CBS 421 / NBRC 0211 / NRRL Y-12639) TaxID=1071378 RepID=G0WEK6_NAUDC|nr:hypothetical protein NDAI_0H00430 [Naumovozyma dairenensis CBS 421]CCD26217.1 hypothetical protein NDAI_0H00430 [Naumovozyma dairenensis CBS 421]